MMTGEFEYVELMYPETETLERSRQNSSVSPLGKNFSSCGDKLECLDGQPILPPCKLPTSLENVAW